LKTLGLFIISILVSPVLADVNPFMDIRDRDQWAIEQVMEHKAPDDFGISPSNHTARKTVMVPPTPTPFQTKTYNFQTETDQAKVNTSITDLGTNFIIDISCDQVIQGWLLKRQSTREVFLRGNVQSDNPYKCRVRVNRPYIKDFGLTVYVTDDSDPAFVQLF
jgi:hypothetical protein